MNEIEEKALALVNEVSAESDVAPYWGLPNNEITKALCRAIEQHEADKAAHAATIEGILNSHEAFRQGVSDALVEYFGEHLVAEDGGEPLGRFVLPKPDPLVEALNEMPNVCEDEFDAHDAAQLRRALAKRGLKIVETGQ